MTGPLPSRGRGAEGALTGSGSHAPDPTWQGAAMIRHVLVFTWTDAADAGRRAAAVEALRGLREDVGGMSSLVVAEDAGLAEGNGDAVHQSVLTEHVRPWLAARAAVQYRI